MYWSFRKNVRSDYIIPKRHFHYVTHNIEKKQAVWSELTHRWIQLTAVTFLWYTSLHCVLQTFHSYTMNRLSDCESVEITNEMQPCNRIYYSKIYWRLNMFLSDIPFIIRSSKLYLQPLVYIPIWWQAVVQVGWELELPVPTQPG